MQSLSVAHNNYILFKQIIKIFWEKKSRYLCNRILLCILVNNDFGYHYDLNLNENKIKTYVWHQFELYFII